MPDADAGAWVEFEGGDSEQPIWDDCLPPGNGRFVTANISDP